MRHIVIGFLWFFCLLVFPSVWALGDDAQTQYHNPSIPVLSINGAIGPAVADYLIRGIEQANLQLNTPLLIITLDTPGGLVSSLRDINQAILGSKVPVACLVHPEGARAASAGTYILYACHVAAMAEATTLGAATPVQIGGPGLGGEKPQESQGMSAMEKKILNDSIAYIRSLAQLRGRNEQWAELAVREAATLTADEALEQNVINMIAASPEVLVNNLDQQVITVGDQARQLEVAGVPLNYQQPDWRNQFITTITDPNVAYILMLLGIYGLLLEFYSPGIGIAGVIGSIALIVALYAFQALPVNYAGVLLLLLGLGLLITESMLPSFGIFGFGGLVAFVLGSVFLIDSDMEQFKIALPLIAAVAVATGAFVVLLLGYIWRGRKRKVVSGVEAILGAQACVLADFDGQGKVLLGGECWSAVCDQPLKKDQTVTVSEISGLMLKVNLPSENDS
jgi:membrane-bound serine protease (ClpP class)